MDRREAGRGVADGRLAAAVIVLTRRIQWFDHGRATKAAQHHHAWIFFDFALPPARRQELIFAHGPDGQRSAHAPFEQATLPLYGAPATDEDR